ncbi:hypothetical protein L7F22_049105 [Adiantum nelumboides]|nr:hypothetical protein [Adiantum nelumboides]
MAVSFPTFYGHHDENARDFMDSLEMAHLMAGRDQEEVKLRAFPLVLKGKARIWYDALASPSKATWPTLYGAFLNKYSQGDTPENLWKQLLRHRQGSLGDYNTYESKFTNLWERWAASLQGQGGAPNFLKRDKFVEGMFPTLKEKVEAKFPQTFEEAQEIATVKFKKLLYQERKSNCVKEREEVNVPQHTNNAQPKVAPISADSHQEDLLHKLTQQLETLTLNLVQAPTRGQQPRDDARPLRRSTQELRCWNCNETGHGMYHCPHPRRISGDMYPPRRPPQTVQFDVPQQSPTIQRGPPPNQEQARGPRRQAQEYHCYNCGENGHGMYYCPHPRRIGNFRGPRDQVSPPRERQQQQPPFPIQQAPPVQIPRPPMQPQSQQSPSPPPPIVPIPPLPIQENRVVNVISLDVKVKSKKEDRGKSLPKDKGKAKVEDVDVLSIKRSRKEEVAISERRERRKSKENGDSSSKKKSKPKRKITTKDLALGEPYQPYNLVDDALIHGPKITWPQLLHLASKVLRQWTKMVSTRCVKTKAMGLVSNRNLRDITPALEAYVKGKRVSNVYVDGGGGLSHHPWKALANGNAARQDWGTGMLKLQPHQGAKKGKAIHIDLRAGKHESLDLGTSVDEFSSSKYFTSREKSIVTEYSDSSQAKIMEVMITNPAMVSSNNILQVKEGFLVDGYNQITGAFMVHINKQQVMPQMLATTFAKFSFDFLLKTFVNVTMEGSLSLVLWHWVLFAHVSKWVAPLQGSNYTMQTWSSIGLVGMLTHECYEEKIKLASLQAGQGKEVVLLGETHSPNLDGVYTLKLNKATIEIVIYNEKEAKLFGVNLVVDRFMFSDALLSAKQVKIPWICGSQSLVSQDWKEVKLVKKIIGTQPLLTKEIQGVSTTTSEPPYYEVIANKKLLQVPLSQQRKHWLDTMRLREIEAFPEDPNNRRRWLIRKATRYKNRQPPQQLLLGLPDQETSDEEKTDTDKDRDSEEFDCEDILKGAAVEGPSEYERSDEEDTSTPLKKKSQKPRSREQVLMDEAMARVEARRKELADARAAKAAKIAKPTTMEETKKLRIGKSKALQKERKRLEVEQKAQEEAEATQAAQTQEKEVIDLTGTVEYLKKIEREKHIAEQWAAQLAREKIKEALSKKAKEPILKPSQGNPKRHRQEDEEEIEHIQADPIPSSPMNIPPTPPSSLITPFPRASTPRIPPSPTTLDPSRSPPAPASPQQQQPSTEFYEVPPSIQEEKDQSMDRIEEEKKQVNIDKPKQADIELQIPLMQLEEPTHEEAYEEIKHFDYTKIILTLSRQFKCQQAVAKKTDFQKERADRAYKEVTNLRTALELVTQKRDTNAKENENLLQDLINLQSQLTRKEAQNHELIKNKKKMKEQLKYEDARKNCKQKSSRDNSLSPQHEAKVKQLELELAQAKADLELQKQQSEALSKGKEAVGSLASTSQISQAEIHLHIQLPPMPEMPDFPSTQEEEQQRLAPGALDVREELE